MKLKFWNTVLDLLGALNYVTERAWLWAWQKRQAVDGGVHYEDLT